MMLKSAYIGFLSSLLILGGALCVDANHNEGLGPLSLRNQFPLTLKYLNMTPDTPFTLRPGKYTVSYQLAIANTFINTRGASDGIRANAIRSGLEKKDFLDEDTGLPRGGSNLLLDVESYRQLFRFQVGLPWELEFGMEQAFVDFGSGFMDPHIEAFHDLIGVDNHESDGAYRSRLPRNQFGVYFIRNNEFIVKEDTPFILQPADPTFDLKWNLYDGSNYLPALSFKLAYKLPLDTAEHGPRSLLSSGKPDTGLYYLLSKHLSGRWFIYGMGGQTFISVQDKEELNDRLEHRTLGVEFKQSDQRAWMAQWTQQSSIFPNKIKTVSGTFPDRLIDRSISTPTDVLVFGLKQIIHSIEYSLGFLQDINQNRNETDFVIFFGMEWTP